MQFATKTNTETQGTNYLITQEENESSDEEKNNSSERTKSETEKLPNPLLNMKLPKPSIGKIKRGKPKPVEFDTRKLSDNSVFTNQYEKAAHAKQSVLEKHVKMTENLHSSDRKVCKKFKKGLCRFEKNCKFSHDLDLNLSLPVQQGQESVSGAQGSSHISQQQNWQHRQQGNSHQAAPRGHQGFMRPPYSNQAAPWGQQGFTRPPNSNQAGAFSHHHMSKLRQQEFHMQQAMQENDESDNYMAGDKRKKRVGVGQSLVPPKKAMTALGRQREEERPWTVHKY